MNMNPAPNYQAGYDAVRKWLITTHTHSRQQSEGYFNNQYRSNSPLLLITQKPQYRE